jgi:phosphopantetheinyl transferase
VSHVTATRVRVYQFELPGELSAGDWECLRDDERERAAGIVDPVRRRRFVARRARLHRILSRHEDGVFFSTSDSGDIAAVAVATRPVGVDIEVETARRRADRIAERMFAADERGLLAALDGAARRRLFHRCWVAKEAYAKGLGAGLGMRFDEFSVAPALRSPTGVGAVAGGWSVAVTSRGDRHLAVALEGERG